MRRLSRPLRRRAAAAVSASRWRGARIGLRPGPFERLVAGYRLERIAAESLPGTAAIPDGRVRPLHLGTVHPLRAHCDLRPRHPERPLLRHRRDAAPGPHRGRVRGARRRLRVRPLPGAAGERPRPAPRARPEAPRRGGRGPGRRARSSSGSTRPTSPTSRSARRWGGPSSSTSRPTRATTPTWPCWGRSTASRSGPRAASSTGATWPLGGRWLFSDARAGAGRTRASRIPFSGDLALRLDTPVGSFNLSLGYALDNFL